jgi:trehalose 6-phosphate phosphatase
MEHLFEVWEEFSEDIRAASRVLLLSDYDGTLTPIVSRPRDALLAPGVREKLASLAGNPAFRVGIISGRPLMEVQVMVGIEGIYYAGNHGLEIEGPGLSYINPEAKAARAEMEDLAEEFSSRLSGIEGVIIEDKELSLSVHYRMVAEDRRQEVIDVFRKVTAPKVKSGKIRVSSGKMVLEIRPPIDWHKGKAVETIEEQIYAASGGGAGTVIYLGDDTTDEDAFRIVQRPRGWSVFVGGENILSAAEYYLESVTAVEVFLLRLLELKRR